MSLSCLFVGLLLALASQWTYAHGDEIHALPGFNDPSHEKIPFKHYAGHIQLPTQEK